MGTRLLLDMSRPVTAGAAWITSGRAHSVSSQTSADPKLAPARMPPATHVSGTGRMDRLRITTAHGQDVLMRVTPVPADPGGTGQARTNGNRCGWRAAESNGSHHLGRRRAGKSDATDAARGAWNRAARSRDGPTLLIASVVEPPPPCVFAPEATGRPGA